MKVIIHIGHPKTGSTYLQRSFVYKSEELAKNAVIYPISKKIRPLLKKGTRLQQK